MNDNLQEEIKEIRNNLQDFFQPFIDGLTKEELETFNYLMERLLKLTIQPKGWQFKGE